MSDKTVTAEIVDKSGMLTEYDKTEEHPEGFTRSVINKIQADINDAPASTTNRGGSSWSRSDYSEEELAAWDYYHEKVLGNPEEVHRRADANEAAETDEAKKYDVYDEDATYIAKPDSGFAPPTVNEYQGGDNASRALAVSTAALEYFAKQIDAISGDGSGMLLEAKKQLGEIDLRPGGFAKAETMRQKIVGASSENVGLRGDTMQVLQAVHDALYQIQLNIRSLIVEYDSAEEFNKLTTEQFGEVMEEAWGKIGNIKVNGGS